MYEYVWILWSESDLCQACSKIQIQDSESESATQVMGQGWRIELEIHDMFDIEYFDAELDV